MEVGARRLALAHRRDHMTTAATIVETVDTTPVIARAGAVAGDNNFKPTLLDVYVIPWYGILSKYMNMFHMAQDGENK